MNFSLQNSYGNANMRGHLLHPLLFDQKKLEYQSYLTQHWYLYNLNDYVNLDYCLTILKN